MTDAPTTELTIEACRPEVQAFAVLMERKLRANDHKTGWKSCRIDWLFGRVRDEATELGQAIQAAMRPVWSTERPTRGWNSGFLVRELEDGTLEYAHPGQTKSFQPSDLWHDRSRIASEAADVANFAMMIADVAGALPGSGE